MAPGLMLPCAGMNKQTNTLCTKTNKDATPADGVSS